MGGKQGNDMNFLRGKKTYITAGLMGLIGLAKMLGVEVPGMEQTDPGQLLGQALAFGFLRSGVGK
ncbi:hypothetical protein VSS37_15205 [Candidatus Thiothrix sp. Deng01]|uniref:Uncharacterized protein n=1 Tax=Candidatus Thiothrix phosphatis TaxID=3112415 RepID=A0ABU6CZS1_9GAMM|nr:hypothetical protein [Candidatus Thiothrix sp. Deng01]MEB4592334.1 hypothetical protein [Candidatus Thiothrix sp. Deng01]